MLIKMFIKACIFTICDFAAFVLVLVCTQQLIADTCALAGEGARKGIKNLQCANVTLRREKKNKEKVALWDFRRKLKYSE